MQKFTIEPLGPFSLAAAADFAGGFAAGIGLHGSETALLATFPVEGWDGSVAVDIWQTTDGIVHGEIHGTGDPETVKRQVARSLSLDHDGRGWEEIEPATRSSGRSRPATTGSDPSASIRRTRRPPRS